MIITKLEFSKPPANNNGKLLAFCRIVLDDALMIRDLKIIQHEEKMFITFPNKLSTSHCQGCAKRNPISAIYCMNCGIKQEKVEVQVYLDVAHPVSNEFRKYCEDFIIPEWLKQ